MHVFVCLFCTNPAPSSQVFTALCSAHSGVPGEQCTIFWQSGTSCCFVPSLLWLFLAGTEQPIGLNGLHTWALILVVITQACYSKLLTTYLKIWDNVIQIRCRSHSGVFGRGGVCARLPCRNGPLGLEPSRADESLTEAPVAARTVSVGRRRAAGGAGQRTDMVQVRQKARRLFHMGRYTRQRYVIYLLYVDVTHI